MKRILILLLSLIIIGAIGYGAFYLISKNPKVSVSQSDISTVMINDNEVCGWREDDRSGVSSEKGLMKSWPD